MDKGKRPVGRKKKIGSGSAGVEKRGEGLGGRTEGPVGMPGGYSGRPSSFPGSQREDESQPGGYPGSGRAYAPSGGGGLKKLIMLIIIAAVLYYLAGNLGDNSPNLGITPGGAASDVSYDKGAYPVDTTVSPLARDKFTSLIGNGDDVATIMIYMCGTDLEANGGMATADLQEMLNAQISDKVNIIVETGGTSSWKNSVISNRTNQRYQVTSEGLRLLERDIGRKSMVKPETLSDFIRYCKGNYPADRYALIFWDHGAGSLRGYGYDQNYPGDSMTLDEIGKALRSGGCKFDFVGFDACLMATLETAMVIEPYADYMIASEEVEPGIGWYYTGWISSLSDNTSMPTTSLGKKLIDDYVAQVKNDTPRSQATLSLIDLAELKGTVPSSFAAFAASTGELIDKNEYKTVSNARAGSKEFAQSSQINQIDLIDFAEKLGTREAKDFADVLRSCIKYNRMSSNITNANGVSIFFPYGRLSTLDPMLETYDEIGIDESYSNCIKSFASVTTGGQITSGGAGNLLETLLQGLAGGQQPSQSQQMSGADAVEMLLNAFLEKGDFSSITGGKSAPSWLDVNRMKSSLEYYKDNRLNSSDLVIKEKGGQRVLSLTEEQWALVQTMEQNVFIDDGEGFIDLGLDNVFEYNDDGDLIMEYDGTWLTLNGHVVSYYMMSDDRYGNTYSTKGRVPAMLNGQLVDIIVVFDNDYPDGRVLGAQRIYDPETETETVAKGLIEIVKGDNIDFLCDYYTYDGEYSDTYYLGEQYIATGEWTVENLALTNRDYQMTYRITDIYNNKYWTPSVTN